jgi:hypothetical protein
MMEQKKQSLLDLDDGFSGYTTESEGDVADERPNSLIVGLRIKFDGKAIKYTVNGVILPKDFQALAIKTLRAVLKWHPDKSLPPEYKVLAPNEKFPDIDARNEEAPKSEWITGPDGKPCGPYQKQSVLYLLGITPAMERYTFAATANNGHVAIEQLASTITWRRQTTGKPVYAVVGFSDVLWSKRFGMQRPYFIPVRWVEPNFGNDTADTAKPINGNGGALADAMKTIEETVASAVSTQQTDEQLGLKSVAEPTLREDLKDEVPF